MDVFHLDKNEFDSLATARKVLLPKIMEILTDFYSRVQLLPGAPRILGSEQAIAGLKAGVKPWFENVLLQPPIRQEGAERLRKLGVKHVGIGVPLSYIVAAFGTLQDLCMQELCESPQITDKPPEEISKILDVFRKRLHIEQLGFVSAYAEHSTKLASGQQVLMEKTIADRSQNLKSTVSLSQAIADEIDEEQIIRVLVDHVLKTFSSNFVEINMLGPGQVVEPALVVTDGIISEPLDNSFTRAVQKDWHLCRVGRTGKPFLVSDVANTLITCPYQPTGITQGSYCCLPIASGATILGWMHLAHQIPAAYSDSDLEILTIYGRMVGTAISSLRLLKQNAKHATVDALTGLHNRRYFEDVLAKEQIFFDRRQKPIALLMLDIDHFKGFNDQFGHEVGDAILVSLSETLNQCIREMDEVARVGGDEIVIMLRDCTGKQAQSIAQQIIEKVSASSISAKNTRISLGVSIGMALCPEHGTNLEDVWHLADEALFQAKNQGRKQCVMYSTSANTEEPVLQETTKARQ